LKRNYGSQYCGYNATAYNNNKLPRPKRVFIIGLTISAFILTILFAYKYYVSDIEINIIYIGILLVLPVLLMQHLEKREKEEPNRTKT